MGRANNQITYDSLPKSYQKKVILVVPESERKLYKYDTNYLTVPDNIKGIAETRKYICEDAGEIRFSMVDDDVVLKCYWILLFLMMLFFIEEMQNITVKNPT